MKKIFMLLFFVIQLFFVTNHIVLTIKADSLKNDIEKNLICNVGTSQMDLLEYNGYTIQSTNVNFNKCGSYQVIYENDLTKEQIVKHIIVKTNDELINGTNFETTENLYFEKNDNIIFNKVLKLDDGGYVVSYNERIESGEDEKFNIKLMKIKDKTIEYDIMLFANTKGKVADFIIDNDKIVLFVEKENVSSMQDVYFFVYSIKGELLKSKQYYGSKVDHAKKIVMDEHIYYLVGETTSDDDDFRFQHTRRSGFCLCINRQTLEDIAIYDATSQYDLEVVDTIVNGDYLYIIGRYYSTMEKMKHTVVYIYRNTKRELANVVNLSMAQTESVNQITSDANGNLFLATYDYDYTTKTYVNHIYSLTQTCAKTLLFDSYYEKEGNANLIGFIVTPTNQQILLYDLYNKNQSTTYGYLYRVYQDNVLLFEMESFSYNEKVSGLIENDSLKLYKSSNSTLSIDQISYAYFNYTPQQTIEQPNDTILYPRLFIDGKEAILDEKASYIPNHPSIYGSYIVKYVFNSEKAQFIFEDSVYFLPYVNMMDQGIYDVNTILVFNGKATLNHYQIENGYLVTQPGEYTLITTGINDETYTIHFTIKQLSSSLEKIPPKIPEVKIEDVDIPIVKKYMEVNCLIDEQDLIAEKRNNLWYLLIPISLFVAFSIIIKKRR
jgi:hypothetical protein